MEIYYSLEWTTPSSARLEKEPAVMLLWDGGNNDVPFFKPDFARRLA
jgi:hypothetical protein